MIGWLLRLGRVGIVAVIGVKWWCRTLSGAVVGVLCGLAGRVGLRSGVCVGLMQSALMMRLWTVLGSALGGCFLTFVS